MFNDTYLVLALQLAGIFQLVLSIASVAIPKVLGWKQKMLGWDPLMKQLFNTYAGYIYASHIFFALVSIFYAHQLVVQSGVNQAWLAFVALWWSMRLYMQFFGFDLEGVTQTRFNLLCKHMLTLLFVYLVLVYWGVLLVGLCWK